MPITKSFAGLSMLGLGMMPFGDFESIATVTVGSGGSSTITFSSIPSGYQHLQIRFAGYANASGWITSRVNGYSSGGQYAHRLQGNGSSATAGNTVDNKMYHLLHDAAGYVAGVLDVLDYGNTSKNTTIRGFCGTDRNGAGDVIVSSGLYASTTAVTSFTLLTTSTLAEHSTAALFGIKA